MTKKFNNSLLRLLHYIESENYRGYDPYDALNSPFLKLPVIKNNKLIRFGVQQVVKRARFDLRKFLLIPKGYNPVTLGLCLQSYGYLTKIFPEREEEFIHKAGYLIDELKKMIAPGFSGACWGYDFDWEARYAKIPAYQPTVVATGVITNGLFKLYEITGNNDAFELCKSACNFILNDLNRMYDGNTFCFSYSPYGRQIVYNASMKGARCLSQVYSVTKENILMEEAERAVKYVVNNQNEDGSWMYGKQKTTEWIDNYHTGYVLDCLDEIIKNCNKNEYKENLKKGISYYTANFFEDNKIPRFYSHKTYPVDCTSAGQSILSLSRFGYYGLAENVINYMTETMQDKEGYFYFRNYGTKINKTSFMRWSNAWMLAALSYYLYRTNEK